MDREERQEYTLILTASDLGSPPQQTSRLLKVVVKDIDDHRPTFNRQRVRAQLSFPPGWASCGLEIFRDYSL